MDHSTMRRLAQDVIRLRSERDSAWTTTSSVVRAFLGLDSDSELDETSDAPELLAYRERIRLLQEANLSATDRAEFGRLKCENEQLSAALSRLAAAHKLLLHALEH